AESSRCSYRQPAAGRTTAGVLVQLFGNRLVAARTDAVCELRVAVLHEVAIDLLPVVLVGADALAVRADPQEAAPLLHLRKRRLQLLHAGREAVLERQDARADAEARQKLAAMERFHEVVVGARFEPGHYVLTIVAAGQQNQIAVTRRIIVTRMAADV